MLLAILEAEPEEPVCLHRLQAEPHRPISAGTARAMAVRRAVSLLVTSTELALTDVQVA